MDRRPRDRNRPELWKVVCDRIADIIVAIIVLAGIVLYVVFHTPGMFLHR